MTPKAVLTSKVVTAPKPVAAQKPVMTPQRVAASKPLMAPKAATTPKLFAESSIEDSMFAVPASSAPAASTAEQVPDSPSPPPRIVPFEKTAAFSSRAKAARPKSSGEPKPIDEQQKKKKKSNEQEPSAVLLDIDQSAEESAEAQVRNFLFSPGMADLTGITFPKEDEVKPLGSAAANFKGEPALVSADLHGSITPDSNCS